MKYQVFNEFLDSIILKNKTQRFSIKNQKIIAFLFTILAICQSFRLTWKPKLLLKNSNHFIGFWKLVSYSSVEQFFADFENFSIFALIIGFLPVSCLFLSFLQLTLKILNKPASKTASFIIKSIIFLLEKFILVPSLIILFMIIKYSRKDFQYISEVSKSLSSETLNFGPKGIIGAVFSLILLAIFIALNQGCCYEISHSKSKDFLTSKCFYEPDFLEKILVFFRCFLYVQIASEFYTVYLILELVSFLCQGFCYFRYMNYYNPWMNKVKIIESLEGLCFSLGFLVAQLIDNSNIAFMLTLAAQPCVVFVAVSLVESRYDSLNNKTLGPFSSSKISFEHSVRNKLIQEEIIENFFKTSQKQLNETGDSFLYLLEAFYSQRVLKNSMLGLNKLSQFKPSIFKLFVGFHVFQAYNELTLTLEESTGSKLVLFLDSIENIIKSEMKYINSIKSLSNEISQSFVSLKSLKSCIKKISKHRLKVHQTYEICLKSYPNSSIALEMLGTFLENILNDPDLGRPILDRARFEDSSHVGKKNLLSSLTHNLMLLSVDPKEVGKILYLSHHLCNIFNIRFSESQDYYLKDFIPAPFSKKHDVYMKKFIKYGETHVYSPGFTFFMKTRDDFMVEFEIHAEYLTINRKSFIIAILQKSKLKREAALISKNGDIYMNTQKFGARLGFKNFNFEGKNFFGMIGQQFSENSNNFITVRDKKTKTHCQIGISLQTKTVKNTEFHLVYLAKNLESASSQISNHKKRFTAEPKFIKYERAEIKNYSQYSENSNSEATKVAKQSKVFKEPLHLKLIVFKKSKKIYDFLKFGFIAMILIIFVLDVVLMIDVNQQVQHSSSLGSLNILGYYKYMSSYFGLVTKIVYLNDLLKVDRYYENLELFNIYNELNYYKTELIDNYKDWSYCSISKDITEKSTILYYKNKTELKSIINEIIDFTSIVIDIQAKSFIDKATNKTTNYETEANYIHMNKFRLSFYKYEYFHDSFTTCEVIKVEKLKKTVYTLFYLSLLSLLFYSLFIIIMIALLKTNLNVIWRAFYKKGKHGLPILYENLTERIKNLYKRLPRTNLMMPVFLNISKFDDFHHSYLYLFKFSFFIIFVLISYSVGVMIFYERLHYFLIKRIYFTNSDIDQRFNIINLSYFMIQSVSENESVFNSIISQPDLFSNSLNEVSGIKHDIIETRNMYFKSDLQRFYTEKAWKILYSSISDKNSYLKYGILQAYFFILQEIDFLVSRPFDALELQKFVENLKDLVKVLNDTGVELENNTNQIINQEISTLMLFFIISFILLLFLTLFWYLPLLTYEKSLLDELEKFIETIPSTHQVKNHKPK